MIWQKEISLPAFPRGIHLIDQWIEQELPKLPEAGLLHVFIKHTSAALSLNENADPTVRSDIEEYLDRSIPDGTPWFRHNYEGDDDMPAHIKSSLVGSSLILPVSKGRINTGTWQGIYLCEFRNFGGSRKIVLTLSS